MSNEKQKISNLLKEIQENSHKKVLVYSLDGCPACEELKDKFERMGLVYENIEMTDNDEMWDKLTQMGGSEYVPQVKVENYLIKEDEYEDVNELIGKTLSNLLERKIIIK
jgi:glutaredoxin